MNNQITRRKFLGSLGLGVGATLLMPVADMLVSRAVGSPVVRKRFVVFMVHGLQPRLYVPDAFTEVGGREEVSPMKVESWPEMFEPWMSRRNNLMLIDGLHNSIKPHQHRMGYGSLTCVQPLGNPEKLAPPAAISLDQFLANSMGADAPRKSLLWGFSGDSLGGKRDTQRNGFAAGREQPLSHLASSRAMFTSLFGNVPDEGGTAEAIPFTPIRDLLKEDIKRLRRTLAAEEQFSLDGYEQAIVEFDRRQLAAASLDCGEPPSPLSETVWDPSAHFESMMNQTILALKCGMTQVVGITIGTSNNHNRHWPNYRESLDAAGIEGIGSHAGGDKAESNYIALEAMHKLHLSGLARLADELANTSEGEGSTVFDHTTMMYTSTVGITGSGHHSNVDRWPVVLMAGDQSGVNTGDRYMRFPKNSRALVDVYRTLIESLGADATDFATETPDTIRGSVEEILA